LFEVLLVIRKENDRDDMKAVNTVRIIIICCVLLTNMLFLISVGG
jgi:hypothetical protein